MCSDTGCFSGYGFESASTVNQFEQFLPGYKGLVVSTASKQLYILEDSSGIQFLTVSMFK